MKINELSAAHQGKVVRLEGELSSILVNPSGILDVRLQTGGGTINCTVDPQAARGAEITVSEVVPAPSTPVE